MRVARQMAGGQSIAICARVLLYIYMPETDRKRAYKNKTLAANSKVGPCFFFLPKANLKHSGVVSKTQSPLRYGEQKRPEHFFAKSELKTQRCCFKNTIASTANKKGPSIFLGRGPKRYDRKIACCAASKACGTLCSIITPGPPRLLLRKTANSLTEMLRQLNSAPANYYIPGP